MLLYHSSVGQKNSEVFSLRNHPILDEAIHLRSAFKFNRITSFRIFVLIINL